MAIFFTSDIHYGHNKEFLYKPRGFSNIDDMNASIFNNYQEIVSNDDDVYILGDLTLGDNEAFKYYFPQMKGHIHIIRGNHDTDSRIELYKTYPQVVEIVDAKYVKCGKYHLYLSHFPTLTGNLENEHLSQMTLNFYGHTHQRGNFFEERPYMYHVGVDSHECFPVSFDQALSDMRNKVIECKSYLGEKENE